MAGRIWVTVGYRSPSADGRVVGLGEGLEEAGPCGSRPRVIPTAFVKVPLGSDEGPLLEFRKAMSRLPAGTPSRPSPISRSHVILTFLTHQ